MSDQACRACGSARITSCNWSFPDSAEVEDLLQNGPSETVVARRKAMFNQWRI
jgi:hypothetical protein